MYGPKRANTVFYELFGKSSQDITDTEFTHFSTYIYRFIRQEQAKNASNQRVHALTSLDKVHIYESLHLKPRMLLQRKRMLDKQNHKDPNDIILEQFSAKRPNTAPPSNRRPFK